MDNTALRNFYKQFPSDQACMDYIEMVRWPEGIVCPHCGHTRTYKFKNGVLFKCADCKKQFTAKADTIFSDSHVPLQDWFMTIYMLTSGHLGVSSPVLAKQLEITQKSAWLMLRRIRYAVDAHAVTSQELGKPKREKPYWLDYTFKEAVTKIVAASKYLNR
jgi:transposase-like protein